MRPYTLKIAAGELAQIQAIGNYLRVKTSAVALLVEVPENSESAELEQGDAVELTAFKRLQISHTDGAEQTVKIYIGKNTRLVSSQVGGAVTVSGSVEVSNDAGNPLLVSGTVEVANDAGNPLTVTNASPVQAAFTNASATVTNASASLVAANASRKFLLIQNKDAAGNIYLNLGGAAATVANGVKIPPGGSLLLDNSVPTGAVFAIGDIASNANIVTVIG